MDRRNMRLLELFERLVEATPGLGILRCPEARAVETLAQPELQLAGSLLGKRHGDDLTHLRLALGDDPDDPADQSGRLSRSGGSFDDEGGVEIVLDEMARLRVGWHCHVDVHGIPRRAVRSASGSAAFLVTRRGSSGPQIDRKSHQVHARSAGAAGRNPSSMARSMISSASRPARRLASESATACSAKPPAVVA